MSAPAFEAWIQRGETFVQNHKQAKWALGEWLLESEKEEGLVNWQAFVNWPNELPKNWVKDAAAHFGCKCDTFLQ